MNRVVITGTGIYSCIGKNLSEVRQSLYVGKSGIVLDPKRKEMGYRSSLTGFVEKPQLKGILDRRARVMLPEQGEYAYMATTEALQPLLVPTISWPQLPQPLLQSSLSGPAFP